MEEFYKNDYGDDYGDGNDDGNQMKNEQGRNLSGPCQLTSNVEFMTKQIL